MLTLPSTSRPGRSVDHSLSPEVVNALRSTLVSQSEELDELREALAALDRQRRDELAVSANAQEELVHLRDQLEHLQREKVDAAFGGFGAAAEAQQPAPPQQGAARVPPEVQAELEGLRSRVGELEQEKEEAEGEQTDLLVLLEELTAKRRGDKRRLREAGLEASEDEDEGEDGGEERGEELV